MNGSIWDLKCAKVSQPRGVILTLDLIVLISPFKNLFMVDKSQTRAQTKDG